MKCVELYFSYERSSMGGQLKAHKKIAKQLSKGVISVAIWFEILFTVTNNSFSLRPQVLCDRQGRGVQHAGILFAASPLLLETKLPTSCAS